MFFYLTLIRPPYHLHSRAIVKLKQNKVKSVKTQSMYDTDKCSQHNSII